MEVDVNIIKEKYESKALVDRKRFRDKMIERFGYGRRTFSYKLSGDRKITEDEMKFIKDELKLA